MSRESLETRLLDDPDDAAAWSAYAAHLLAHGDPHGELLALESLAETPAERAWISRVRDACSPPWATDCEWRHTFVVRASIRVDGRADVRHLAELLADPRARLLGGLRIVFGATAPRRALGPIDAADFSRLRALQVCYHPRGNRVVRALVDQPALHLRTLDLRHSGLSDDGLIALARCRQLHDLRALHLQHNRFTARGVAALAESPALAGLTLLDLRHNAIGPAGAAALAASPHLAAIETLHLHAAELAPAGVHALATSTTLPRDLVRYWRAQDTTR
jgi:hypothetical protein